MNESVKQSLVNSAKTANKCASILSSKTKVLNKHLENLFEEVTPEQKDKVNRLQADVKRLFAIAQTGDQTKLDELKEEYTARYGG